MEVHVAKSGNDFVQSTKYAGRSKNVVHEFVSKSSGSALRATRTIPVENYM
jgi:hypothetical protein